MASEAKHTPDLREIAERVSRLTSIGQWKTGTIGPEAKKLGTYIYAPFVGAIASVPSGSGFYSANRFYMETIKDAMNAYPTLLAERDAALVAVEEAKKALEEIVHECVNFENSSRKSLEVILGITHRALSSLPIARVKKP